MNDMTVGIVVCILDRDIKNDMITEMGLVQCKRVEKIKSDHSYDIIVMGWKKIGDYNSNSGELVLNKANWKGFNELGSKEIINIGVLHDACKYVNREEKVCIRLNVSWQQDLDLGAVLSKECID